LAPEDMRASRATDSTTVTFNYQKNVYTLIYRYNKAEDKGYNGTLILMSGEPIQVTSDTTNLVQKTGAEFFAQGRVCNRISDANASKNCHAQNMVTALDDCNKFVNCTHCWMSEHCGK